MTMYIITIRLPSGRLTQEVEERPNAVLRLYSGGCQIVDTKTVWVEK